MNDFDIQDDLNLDPAAYPARDNTPRPPLPGNYIFKTAKWQYRSDKQGNMVLWKDGDGNPKYPVISLTTVEITDPFEFGRKVVLFQDIATAPFQREGKVASKAADLLQSFDANAVAGNTGEVLRQLTDLLNGGMEFASRLDYSGYDKVYAAQMVSELPADATARQKNEAYAKAKIQGYKKILSANAAAGRPELPAHKWVGPSGNVIDVQPVLTVFYASNDRPANLGPDKALIK
jgi:hypothetical protein